MLRIAAGGAMLLALLVAGPLARAETPEEKGLAIARETDRRDAGWQDTSVDLKMLLKNKQGQESARDLRIRGLEVPGDGKKSLVIFDSPRDVSGTALLTFSHKVEDDEQWLFLPALRRVKRIASDNKSGPFVGSEFSYEDMIPQEVEKFTYKYVGDEPCGGGLTCFVVERYPVDKQSGYTKQVVWVDNDQYRVWKIDYYDRKNSLLKTLINEDYKQYLDKFWRPHSSDMVNHQSDKSTTLTYSDFKFRTGLSDSDFNPNRLQSVR